MSKPSSASKIKLNSVEALFGNANTSSDIDSADERISEIPLSELHEFKGHPFQVHDDEKMDETVESIKIHGVLVPGIVRMRARGGYEIISGHRRRRACELAGLETMPVFIRNLTDDEATIVMVDSNIQREEILPSEKARAYKMKYEAMKHQGVSKEKKGKSLEMMSEDSGENIKKIQRYLRLAELSDDWLELLDNKKLGMAQGVDISYLPEEEQGIVYDVVNELDLVLSMIQSGEIRKLSGDGELSAMAVKELLTGKIKPGKRNVTIKAERINEYFPEDYSEEDITEIIIGLLEEWKAGR